MLNSVLITGLRAVEGMVMWRLLASTWWLPARALPVFAQVASILVVIIAHVTIAEARMLRRVM
jgi:hypothetical protein